MARKKLNKKVAIIGAIVFVLLALVIMALLFLKSRSPAPFIADGDKAMDTKDYEQAIKSYTKALGRARADSLKIEVLYKLADAYLQSKDWPRVVGCWERIVQIEPTNVHARLERLRYFYAIADSGIDTFWQTVQTQVDEFFDQIDQTILSEDLSKWKTFETDEKPVAKRIDSFLYFLRGRALIGTARSKQQVGTEQLLKNAILDFQKVLEIEPDNVSAYGYLAQATILQGQELAEKGGTSQSQIAQEKAVLILAKCAEVAKDNPRAHLNLLGLKLILADQKGVDEVKKLEPDYLSLVQKFSNSADAYAGLTNLYLLLSPQQIDKAAQAAEKATELDKNDFRYAQTAAVVYLYQFAIHNKQSPQLLAKSIETAKRASLMTQAQDSPGPRRWEYATNRVNILEFLAHRYIEQVLYPFETISDQKKQQLIKETEDIAYQIQQVVGSGENPRVVKWNGILDIAKGNTDVGVRKLNTIYEQFGGSSARRADFDPFVPYVLAKVYENSGEQGAVLTFLSSAISAGIARLSTPESLLEYCQAALKLELWPSVISNINLYDKFFEPNRKSRSLRILGHIGAGEYEQAAKLLADEPQNDLNTTKLNITLAQAKINQFRSLIVQTQIEGLTGALSQNEPNAAAQARQNSLNSELTAAIDTLAKLVTELSATSPASVEEAYISAVCENFLANGKINQAKEFVSVLVKSVPDNITARFYQSLLLEPQPDKLTAERRIQIEEQIYTSISNPLDRAVNLAMFYRRNNQPAKAAEQFKIVLGDFLQTDADADKSLDQKTVQQRKAAADYLFAAALQLQDWQLATDIQAAAKRKNLDGCEGNFYAARFAAAKKDNSALALFNDCLEKKPIFSYGYLLRSNVRAALGDEKGAIEDAKKAVLQNRQDGAIAKNLASLLFLRNQRLGRTVSEDQKEELKGALDLAMVVNTGDMELFSFYAEFISPAQPQKALAVRQYLLKNFPNIENAVLLGRMATRNAVNLSDQKQKDALFDVAKSAFQQAKSIDPNNQMLLSGIADMYNAMGQPQLAEQTIQQSKNQTLLWALYFQSGQYEEAQKILMGLYQSNPKDAAVLRALLAVSEKTLNKEYAQRFGNELIAIEDNVENRLLQIQVCINTGLIEDAQKLLQALKEKFPNEPKALYIEAWILAMQGKLDNGLSIVNQCIEKDKTYAPAWQLRGRIYLLQADFTKAINDFEQYKLYSDDPAASILKARALLALGREENAIVELKSVVDNPQVTLEVSILLEAVYSRSKRYADLMQLYDHILSNNPDSIFWLNRAGKFALYISDFKSAERLHEVALRKSEKSGRTNADAFNGYLEALLLSKQYDKLFSEANKHLNDELATIAYIEMADAENKRGNSNNAINYATQAAQKTIQNDAMFYETLKAMKKVIGPKPLIDYANQILTQNPNSLPALLILYDLYLSQNDYKNAIANIDKCILLAKNDLNRRAGFVIRKADTLYAYYRNSNDKNLLKLAVQEYESLIAELPKNSTAYLLNNVAYIMAASDERLEDAVNFAKQAYELSPNNPDYLDTYAFALYKSGKITEAEQYIQAAIQMFMVQQKKVSWSVYERQGLILEQRGSRFQAIAAYKQAMQVGADEMTDADKIKIQGAIDRLSK